MSFRQIFDRITRIARAEIGSRESAFDHELRRARELIEESRRREHGELTDGAPSVEIPQPSLDHEYLAACRTIGVAPGSPWEVIATTFRLRARELHPDRVAHLPETEQRGAHRRMQELNLAYEFLERRMRK